MLNPVGGFLCKAMKETGGNLAVLGIADYWAIESRDGENVEGLGREKRRVRSAVNFVFCFALLLVTEN